MASVIKNILLVFHKKRNFALRDVRSGVSGQTYLLGIRGSGGLWLEVVMAGGWGEERGVENVGGPCLFIILLGGFV